MGRRQLDEGGERQEVSEYFWACKKHLHPAEALENLGALSAIMATVGS